MISQPLPLGFVPAAVAVPVAPVVAQAAAATAVAVAVVLTAPVEIPLLAAAAIAVGVGIAIGIAWDALNSRVRVEGSEAGTSWTVNNATPGTLTASFSTYLRNYVEGVTIPTGFVHRQGDDSTALPPGYTSWFAQTTTVTLPPGQSNLSIEYIPTGNTNYNEREWYWKVSVGDEVFTQSIYGYAPGLWLGWAIVHLPESTTATDGGQTVSKPNTLAPQAFKETEKPKPLAPPLPYLPAFAPDIGTPITPKTTPSSPKNPTKKEDPKAPPIRTPSPVPVWSPGVLPATTPGPATVPAPARNPQTIPSKDPARPNVAFDVAAKPLPQAATAVKPTSLTSHQVGPITIPAKAPAATLQGIAEEVGRIEQKLEIVLNPGDIAEKIDWMKRLQDLAELFQSATAAGDYVLTSPCEVDEKGKRIEKKAHFNANINYMAVLSNKIDALAEIMQHSKDLRQAACMATTQPSTVTVTAYELPPYS